MAASQGLRHQIVILDNLSSFNVPEFCLDLFSQEKLGII